jgi:glycine cleavage system H protein
MIVPTGRKYTAEHEWLLIEGDTATVGITAYAADALGDIVYLALPPVGATITAGEACGEIESTKSVSDLFAPATGEVTEINQDAVDDPGVLNLDPFERGWLFRIKLAGDVDVIEPAAYESLIASE